MDINKILRTKERLKIDKEKKVEHLHILGLVREGQGEEA